MKIAVVADEDLKEELMAQGLSPDAEVNWLKEINPLQDIEAYIDVSVTHYDTRIEELKKLSPALIIINSVTATLSELPPNFVRINGWPSFLKRPIAEVACVNDENKSTTEKVFSCFNKTVEWVPDIPGFISARIVSMIINEAYFTLQEGVSSKEEIDIAMKLGTNYPYGPFEWSKKIGMKNVYGLLSKLAETDSRYEPAALLKKRSHHEMSLILNIDTAVDAASVCLAKDGEAIQLAANENQKDHASWLHVAIAKIIKDGGYMMADLQAVAVSIGPGSYTGLRIGLSTAKGLCYALNIPLIAISTLDMMAFAAKDVQKDSFGEKADMICPLIDARRMEVFTAIYDKNLKKIIEPQAMLLDENSFAEFLSSGKIIFLGNGSHKLRSFVSNNNAFFSLVRGNASHLAHLSNKSFIQKEFADLAYIQPLYLKEFYSPARKEGL